MLIRLLEMKLREIEVEEELLVEGNHPDYHLKMIEFNHKRDQRLFKARTRYCMALEAIEKNYETDLKLSLETLKSKKRELKELFIRRVIRQKYHPLRTKQTYYGQSPVVLRTKRIEMVNSDIHQKPDWISQLIRKKKRSGFSRVLFVN